MAKRENSSGSIAGSSVDGKSLMLDRARMSSTASVAKSLRPTESLVESIRG